MGWEVEDTVAVSALRKVESFLPDDGQKVIEAHQKVLKVATLE
jgi:hypothetical protein